jgi:hypothetical protein
MLNENQLINISETLEDFKHLLPRYLQVRGDENLLKRFCIRNRNPVWDISNSKFFDSGLISESSKDLSKKDWFLTILYKELKQSNLFLMNWFLILIWI